MIDQVMSVSHKGSVYSEERKDSYRVINSHALEKRVQRCFGEIIGQNSQQGCMFDCGDAPTCSNAMGG